MADKMSDMTKEKVQEMQILQQRLSMFNAQKQQLQMQQAEINNAVMELEKSAPPVYRLVGEILVEKPLVDLKKELTEKRDEIDLRVKTIEKQESKTREKAQELQKAVTEAIR